jgi:hypothetical protein
VRLKDFVVGDKLELSLKNYLALVMANNTDIQIQMLTLETPKNAIQRAMGIWDPRAIAQFTSQRAVTPSTSALDGVSAELKSLQQPLTMSVTQLLPTGTTYTASWGGTKTTSNASFTNYNPSLSSNVGITFAADLSRGSCVNRLTVMMSKQAALNTEKSDAGPGLGHRERLLGRRFAREV